MKTKNYFNHFLNIFAFFSYSNVHSFAINILWNFTIQVGKKKFFVIDFFVL
jgi:hypothetical protein